MLENIYVFTAIWRPPEFI